MSLFKINIRDTIKGIHATSEKAVVALVASTEQSLNVIEAGVKDQFIKGAGGTRKAAHPTRPTSRTGQTERSIAGKVYSNQRTLVKGRVSPDNGLGTPLAHARRLELGYYGVDKAGRLYNQAPRPYLRTGLMKSKDKATQIFAQTYKSKII
jgi:hypothetical protein